jgi:hypothetical protein
MAPLPFGGNEIFHINEPFLTPRIPACALVLLALERALARRLALAVLLLAGAFALHPLMAFGGALVVLLWWLGTRLPARRLAALAAAVALAGACVVFYPPLGTRVFGHLDDDWRDVILTICFFVDPAVWTVGDWARIGCCAGVAVLAALGHGRRWAGLLLALLVAAGLGIAGNVVAVHSRYLLLYQSSPYRTLWLLELLAVPFGFWGAAWLWRRGGTARCAGLLLVLLLTLDWNFVRLQPVLLFPLLLFAVLLPVCVVYHRGLGEAPRAPDWAARSSTSAFLTGTAVLLAYNALVMGVLFGLPAQFDHDLHPARVLLAAGDVLYKLPLLLLFASGAAVLASRAGVGARFGVPLLVFWLGYQALLTGALASRWYMDRFSAWQPHGQFVADFLQERSAERGGRLTVYWPADLRDLWFTAEVNSYFNSVQLSGCAFNPETAREGRRRGRLVRRFEADGLRRSPIPEPWWQEALERFHGVPEGEVPTARDLRELCADPGLDFVVLEKDFDGLACATDGRYYVFDCRRIRAAGTSKAGQPSRDQP